MVNSCLITVCLSYYNQVSVLVEQVRCWLSYEDDVRDRLSFFVIDDSSKVDALSVLVDGGLKDELSKINLTIFRVNEDKFCNIGGVRNLGASECKTPYMVILDMDTFISYTSAQQMIDVAYKNVGNRYAFTFNRRIMDNNGHKKHGKMHPAVCLVRVEDYWGAGGCDEDFVGNYGYTDPHFWWRAQSRIKKKECHDIYLDYRDDGECDMVRDTNKNRKLFESKKKSGEWSSDFMRFTYDKLYES